MENHLQFASIQSSESNSSRELTGCCRLFTTVRDALGLTYDVSFELSLFDRLKAGWFVISVTSTPAKVTTIIIHLVWFFLSFQSSLVLIDCCSGGDFSAISYTLASVDIFYTQVPDFTLYLEPQKVVSVYDCCVGSLWMLRNLNHHCALCFL